MFSPHPLGAPMVALAGAGFFAGPMDAPADQPILMDSDQFAALGVGLALVVALLAVIAVAVWRR
jgi:hypothetical protein